MARDCHTGRRTVLKAAGASLALGGISIVAGTENVEIPMAYRRGEVAHTKQVPKSWYDHMEHVHDKLQYFKDQYLNKSGVVGIGITHSNEYIKDLRKLEFLVHVDNKEAKKSIPNKASGVRVNIQDAPENRGGGAGVTTTGYCSDNDYADIPGGVRVETADYSHGTSCCKVRNDYGEFLLHAAHVWDPGACDEFIGGQRAIQYDDDFGFVGDWNERHDWVAIEVDTAGISLDNTIRRPSGRGEVNGYVSRNALATWGSDDVYKMGIKTGETVSKSLDYAYEGGWACHNWDGDGVRVGNTFANGDSGGPVFAEFASGPFMISIASQHWGNDAGTYCGASASEGAIGWPAYKLAENEGFEFYLG